MTVLALPSAYFSGAEMLCALAVMGAVIGVLTGLFGVGGGFLVTPMLIVLIGMDESLAVGSSLSFIIGTSAGGLARHWRLGNVEPKCMLILAGGVVSGAILGAMLHISVRSGLEDVWLDFSVLMRGLYLVLLAATAVLVYRGPRPRHGGKPLLQRLRLPPRVDLPDAKLTDLSLFGMCLTGMSVGLLTGMLGVGGGVLFVPMLLLAVGLSAHQAVGTSLGVVLMASVAGTAEHGLANNVSLAVAMALLAGSSLGVQLGAWLCQRLQAARLRHYFATIVLLAAIVVAAELAVKLVRG